MKMVNNQVELTFDEFCQELTGKSFDELSEYVYQDTMKYNKDPIYDNGWLRAVVSSHFDQKRKPLEHPLEVYVNDDYRENYLKRSKFDLKRPLVLSPAGSVGNLIIDFGWHCGTASPGIKVEFPGDGHFPNRLNGWRSNGGVINRKQVNKLITFLQKYEPYCIDEPKDLKRQVI